MSCVCLWVPLFDEYQIRWLLVCHLSRSGPSVSFLSILFADADLCYDSGQDGSMVNGENLLLQAIPTLKELLRRSTRKG